MSASSTVMPSSTVYNGPAFWERLWRMSGINFILFLVIAYLVYGNQPPVGASADAVTAFYNGHSTRILIAAFISGMAVLNLLWFVAALRTTLADTGLGGWGSAAVIASAMVGGLFLLLLTIPAALAVSIAGAGSAPIASGLNDLAWAGLVLTSFPRAMLIMAGSFGLWRARLISNATVAACVAALVLVLLGGSTWMRDGFWAPDGVYSRIISPLIGVVWVVGVSRILLARSPATRAGW